ncbi:uncharacterized protein NPIL_217771 [Nephila pilipes]|uniref:Uncharacterized protein n=1 Tax=Nephila pilipes TaxID=299642 RepID=A0A8X6P9I2_NEPPI|nr:uncharacterized protein NPIL_217771 [Nephila pilipes]
MDFARLPHVGLLSEYQKVKSSKLYVTLKEYLDYWGRGCTGINRRIAAGVTSKAPPLCQNEEYDIGDGILPVFRGESTSKLHFQPQPPLSKQPSYKPPKGLDHPPFVVAPGMFETESVSRSALQPMPMDLARTSMPHWMLTKSSLLPYGTRNDLTSSYQADYCGVKTKPRNICLDSKASGDCGSTEQKVHLDKKEDSEKRRNPAFESLHDRLNDYVKSLLFRTTTGSTYQPPSVYGEICCHPAKKSSLIKKHCPAEKLITKSCKIHRNQEYRKNE